LYDLKQLIFYFKKDKNELKEWINNNVYVDEPAGPKEITDENFSKVYSR
jgi:hypothetical protein